jgi:hypothetical protein
LYHYKANTILATPIASLDNLIIFHAYKENFEQLAQKGFKPKLNFMDNQVRNHIEKFLKTKECKLQLFEPHTHCVNVVEQAIQMFKDAFISTLAMTNRDFPLKLWDRLMPQVITLSTC